MVTALSMQLVSLQPFTEAWQQVRGNRPRREALYWINYVGSSEARLAYWRDNGHWGSGFYCVTQLHTPESDTRDVFRIEPAVYVPPDQWQPVRGEHSIQSDIV